MPTFALTSYIKSDDCRVKNNVYKIGHRRFAHRQIRFLFHRPTPYIKVMNYKPLIYVEARFRCSYHGGILSGSV